MESPQRSHALLVALTFAASLTLAGGAGAAQVVLSPTRDNTLIETPIDNSNGSGVGIYAGRVGTNGGNTARRGVLAFGLAPIPAGSTINTATLDLQMTQSPNVLSRTVTLHRLTADWGEAGSAGGGIGSPAQPGDATWLYRFFNTDLWTTAGGDFVAGASGSQSVTGVGTYSWSGPGLVADVQAWLNAPGTNFGWLLLGDESTSSTVKEFSSKEGATPPKLTVDYTPPTTGVTPTPDVAAVTFAAPWPAPAAGAVRLAYTLPREASVTLAIHDAAGRLVRGLVREATETAGPHAVVWDGRSDAGSRVASGVYLARLVVDGERYLRRVAVAR